MHLDDAFWRGMNAVSLERLVADNPESVTLIWRHYQGHAGFQRDDAVAIFRPAPGSTRHRPRPWSDRSRRREIAQQAAHHDRRSSWLFPLFGAARRPERPAPRYPIRFYLMLRRLATFFNNSYIFRTSGLSPTTLSPTVAMSLSNFARSCGEKSISSPPIFFQTL